MNYNESLEFINKKMSLGIKPGLSRIINLLDKMGNPQNNFKVIHIAGTNGKGTISAMVATSLQKSGFKTGLFMTPWVVSYTEQIRINNQPIDANVFSAYVSEYMNEDVTEFELLTAICIKYFADSNVDYAVIECGMGGQGDATNVFDGNTILSVITAVSLDHTAFLGNTVAEIATEKCGIIKEASKVVLYPNSSEVESVVSSFCAKTSSLLYKVTEYNDFKLNNLHTAMRVMEVLNVKAQVEYPELYARQEYLRDNLMLDGAHNPQGASALAGTLKGEKHVSAVIAMMADKDVKRYLEIIAPLCEKIVATTVPNNKRAMSANDIADIAVNYCGDVTIVDNPLSAYNSVKDDNGLILICGSFYLAREIRKNLL